jgi:hypothetical protein
MIAGLPKSFAPVALCFLVGFSLLASAQSIQTPSEGIDPIFDVQTSSTTIQPIYDAIALTSIATPEQIAALEAAFATAMDAGILTVDQGLEMLSLAQWSILEDESSLEATLSALLGVLNDLSSGVLFGDPLAALADALGDALTPAGILNALGKSGATDAVLDRVQDLVVEGIPPGILVRLTKEALRGGLSEDEIGVIFDALSAGNEGDSWGQLANQVSDQGSYKHQDQEQNQNENTGESGDPEIETEQNQHGNATGSQKSDKNDDKKAATGQGKKG